ncbi:MAG: hypothetical protein NZL83_04740 [Candidatus Absconditabacterales bacterium]|nr:hypothetical protein [Candidatus Absconditabacterales bacterium]
MMDRTYFYFFGRSFMYTVLLILLIISGLIFALSVALMPPKGGLGVMAGSMGGSSHEYGSAKSFESVLKTAAYISGAICVGVSLVLPFFA